MMHAHITSWGLLIVFFIITMVQARKHNEKSTKILHMIMRVLYILVILTGGMMVSMYMNSPLMSMLGVKILLALVLIGMMEMTIPRILRGEKTGPFLSMALLAFLVILYIGYEKLPLTI